MGTSSRGRRQFVDTRTMSDAEVARLLADDPREAVDPRRPSTPHPADLERSAPMREWSNERLATYAVEVLDRMERDSEDRHGFLVRLLSAVRPARSDGPTSPDRGAGAGSGPAARTGSA